MRTVVGFVVVVSAAVLLGAHLEVTKTLASTADTIAPAAPLIEAVAAATSTVFVPASPAIGTTLNIEQVTTTPKTAAPAVEKESNASTERAPQPKQTFTVEVTPTRATVGTPGQYPVRLIIPSIGLDAPIQAVGVNAKGEMDVPDGSTNNIGWYKGGPMPGSQGSAVLDAHVFAALKDLRYAKVGDPVYILTKGGTRLRFTIKESTVFTLSELTSDILFGRGGGQWLNIITCAGVYVPSLGTYDHRLVDFALFESEELQ
jgi:sortase (surface protein transpeptidase)